MGLGGGVKRLDPMHAYESKPRRIFSLPQGAEGLGQTMAFRYYKLISEPDDALKCMICLSVAKATWP